MDWIVYWFMFPVSMTVATLAMFSGISGAAMLIPVFLIAYPLFGLPTLTTLAAIGTALFISASGFSSGVYGYTRRGLVDWEMATSLVLFSLPAAAFGALFTRSIPDQGLRVGYGVAMVFVAYLLFLHARERVIIGPVRVPRGNVRREVVSSDGRVYRFSIWGMNASRALAAGGGVATGMISTGVGEAVMPNLARRLRVPLPVAAATSTVVVAGTLVGASMTHLYQLWAEGGFGSIPWDLIVWAVPGAIIGAQIGTWSQGRLDERVSGLLFAALFLVIGITFIVAFGFFPDRLG